MRRAPGRVLRGILVLVALATLSGVMAGPAGAAGSGEVRALLFYLDDCDHCRVVREEVLPKIQAAFPLVVREVEASNLENSWRLLLFQRSHGVAEGQVPALAVGSEFLVGESEIRARLLGVVLDLAAKGGSDWPADPDPSVVPPPAAPVSDACGTPASAGDACGPAQASPSRALPRSESPEVR